jgi:hypothetical protein
VQQVSSAQNAYQTLAFPPLIDALSAGLGRSGLHSERVMPLDAAISTVDDWKIREDSGASGTSDGMFNLNTRSGLTHA